MRIFENEVQCVLSYVAMENIIFPTVPRLLEYFPISDVSGLTVNVNVPSYFNDVKNCWYCTL
jgi:hypothetical protein